MQTPQLPHPKLSQALGLISELYLKREDLHPYGSHKGRSIPGMIEAYAKQGVRDFVISSSGNAALAAIHAVKAYNEQHPEPTTLKILVGKKIDPNKLQTLNANRYTLNAIQIEQTPNPKQSAFQLDKIGVAKNLRQSTDDTALIGYELLAIELNSIPNLQAIFIPTSSGTTAQALGEWFAKHNPNVQIHIVQTEAVHPVAIGFKNPLPYEGRAREGSSIASAIVDKIAHRKQAVLDLIKKTRGSGWIVSDEEIKNAMELVKEKTDIDISPNSALSIAGLKKAIANNRSFTGAVVCLITGA